MLVIRLRRIGKKNQPSFKIVVTEKKTSPTKGTSLEEVGFWNPLTKEKVLKEERIKYWISVGAQTSDTVHNMLINANIVSGEKIKKHNKAKKKKGEEDKKVKEEVKKEPQEEVKEEVKEESKDKVKEKVKEESKEKVKEEIKEEIKDEVKKDDLEKTEEMKGEEKETGENEK